jgi:hypothetical protein
LEEAHNYEGLKTEDKNKRMDGCMYVKEGVEIGEPYLTCSLAQCVLVYEDILIDGKIDVSAQVSGGKIGCIYSSDQKTEFVSDGNGTTAVFEETTWSDV